MARYAASGLAREWYKKFNEFAGDLYPERYSYAKCLELAEMALEIKERAAAKNSIIVAHNYLFPEFHEIADKVGDSLGLSFYVRDQKALRVDFESVFFMGATAKIITGNATRVFVSDFPDVIGCSLVFGTDYEWLENWKRENPEGILVTYINSDAYTKSISDYISTSRNTHKIIAQAARDNPGKKILVLPDKYLGLVMKSKAVREFGVNPDLVEVYKLEYNGCRACCYVHEDIATDMVEVMMALNPDAELMIHPECGCASSCLMKLEQGIIPREKAYFLSTEGMVERARVTPAKKIIVATEKGLIYRLRKEIPDKTFIPMEAECRYMKENTFEKLLRSLKEDRLEVVLCNDCCDPKQPLQNEKEIHIQKSVAEKAKKAIDRMLAIV